MKEHVKSDALTCFGKESQTFVRNINARKLRIEALSTTSV